ncbi:MAG: hypothetical protein MJZ37_08485 [Bacilli bacterium]|nr:hypothetical protein [Bacilli bacterium]
MAVNEAIYGDRDLWIKSATYGADIERDNMFLCANFSGAESSDITDAAIKKGVDEGILMLNTPIDMSVCWSALGTESPLSHIKNYSYSVASGAPAVRTSDDRSITNWCFARSLQSDIYAYNIKNVESMFAPSNDYTSIRFTGEYQGVKPITNVPIKNAVLYPFVTAVDALAVSHNTVIVSLQEYLEETTEHNYKVSHPYITNVSFGIYHDRNYGGETISRSLYANDSYKCLMELDGNNVYQGKAIGGNTYGLTYQYNHSFCNYSRINTLTLIGCVNSRTETHGAVSDYEGAENDYIIRFTSDVNVAWCTDNANYMIGYIQYYPGFEEYVRKAIACFGMFFTFDSDTAVSGALDDPLMYCGTLVDGIGHGGYTHGADNNNQPQMGWNSSNDSTYDPSNPPSVDPNTYDNTSHFNDSLGLDSTFNRMYILSAADVSAMATDFLECVYSKPEDIDYTNFLREQFLSNNPLDCVVSLKKFPCQIPYSAAAGQRRITLGNYQTVGSGYKPSSLYVMQDIFECTYYPAMGLNGVPSFLDYEPYSTAQLVIPYCGTVNINPSECMGRKIKVRMVVDFVTGGCTAYVMVSTETGYLVIDSISGYCAIDLPVSAIEKSTLDGQLFNANMSLKNAKLNAASNIVSAGANIGGIIAGAATGHAGVSSFTGAIGSSGGILGSINNVLQSQYNLDNTKIPYKTISGASSVVSAIQEQECVLLVYRPVYVQGYDSKKYARTVGNACLESAKISAYSGKFIQVSDVDLSGFNATAEEKNMIAAALKGGVIV